MAHQLSGFALRTGVLRDSGTAWVLAFDPKLEADEDYYTFVSKWNAGTFGVPRKNFNAHTSCVVSTPHQALVLLASDGHYGFVSPQVQASGNVFADGRPQPLAPRCGDLRWVAEIGGQAYAVGHMGSVYRLDGPQRWTRIDEGLPSTFNIEAVHGFDSSDIYLVGKQGALWQSVNHQWTHRELPTNAHLSRVECAGNGSVYIAGHRGMLVQGRDQSWSIVDHGATDQEIWSLKWFNDELYVATSSALFRLQGSTLEKVHFGEETPRSFYHLTAAGGVMWSIGERDVMSFDGGRWSRVL